MEASMFGLGMPEMIVVLVIALVLFGPSKLPELGKGLGEAIRSFKKGVQEIDSPDEPKPIAGNETKHEKNG